VLHILFDCCHSGSAVELPFVYRTDEDGNINLVDNLKEGFALVGEATHLIQGGLRFDKLGEAEQLYAGATDFFKGLMHQGDSSENGRGAGGDGLQQEDFEEDWVSPCFLFGSYQSHAVDNSFHYDFGTRHEADVFVDGSQAL